MKQPRPFEEVPNGTNILKSKISLFRERAGSLMGAWGKVNWKAPLLESQLYDQIDAFKRGKGFMGAMWRIK